MKKIILFFLVIIPVFLYSYTDIVVVKEQIKEYEDYLEEYPNDTQKMFELARLYEYLGEKGSFESFSKAKSIYKSILNISYIPKAQLLYGRVLLKIGKEQWFIPIKLWYVYSGYSEMSDAVRNDPYSISFHYMRANALYELKDFSFCVDTSILDYEYVLNNSNYDSQLLIDNNAEILFKLADLKELKKDYEGAYELYEKITKKYEKSFYSQLSKERMKRLVNKK